jgi:glycosyltransferase involved in cell wall biosynthesis
MKIGITIRSFYPRSGGMQAHAQALAQQLQAKGHTVIVATRSISHSPSFFDYYYFSESISDTFINNIPVKVLGHSKVFNSVMWLVSKLISRSRFREIGIQLFQFLFTGQLVAAFKDVDVIQHVGQAHELIGFSAADAARKLDIPFLIQPTLHPGQWGDSAFDINLYQRANFVLAHTEYERNELQKLGVKGPFSIVGNGIVVGAEGDASRFRKKYGISSKIILFLGRKTADKGYFIVHQAFKEVLKKIPDVVLVCIGPDDTIKQSQESSKEKNVVEIGFVPAQEKYDALAACDLLCVPSEGESFGLVYMEAGLCKKPSIVRRLPVLQELLESRGAALAVGTAYDTGNRVELNASELSDAILKLLEDSALSCQIAANAYQVAQSFLWDQIINNFESAYEAALKIYRSPQLNV